MNPLNFAVRVAFVVAFGGLSACSQEHSSITTKATLAHRLQETTWQPSPGHTQVPIWPAAAPDAQPPAGPEKMTLKGADVPAYKPGVEVVENVSTRQAVAPISPSPSTPAISGPKIPKTTKRKSG